MVDVLEWDGSVTPARPTGVQTALIRANYRAGPCGEAGWQEPIATPPETAAGSECEDIDVPAG
ncbi:hypothetical protein [Streptomyces yangpuensis]|uniref:hypothetical protein n=1 Tax=Streptomyces yangpuensis TaxID=1648182 RepID=UPI000629AAF1|nr:hypothetical protein [Streptomyces yangpuensis]